MNNTEIRQRARASFIPLWKVASKIGVSEMTLSRWLREELSEEKKQLVLNAIEELQS